MKHLEHTLEIYVYSHYNMCNIPIYFCSINIQNLQHTSEISKTLKTYSYNMRFQRSIYLLFGWMEAYRRGVWCRGVARGGGMPAGGRLRGPGERLCEHRWAAARLPTIGQAGAVPHGGGDSVEWLRCLQRAPLALERWATDERHVESPPRKTHACGERRPRRDVWGIDIFMGKSRASYVLGCTSLERTRSERRTPW